MFSVGLYKNRFNNISKFGSNIYIFLNTWHLEIFWDDFLIIFKLVIYIRSLIWDYLVFLKERC